MRISLAPALLILGTMAAAQSQPNTVLVMDGSGSMWGQVDGVAKITIAQEVVGTLLADFPSEQGLGLTVYGHRERGECTDIETVVAPAPGTAGQIVDAVNRIKPLGKTPMTDAVIAAAEALRYTEEKATVILVSDGVETCNPDPCAAARLLEEAGIDFTAHVVGFDVGSDPAALAQMQCIADETGGRFLTADTADQLIAALTRVAAVTPEPEPEPALVPTTLTAVIEGSDTLVSGPVLWDLSNNGGSVTDNSEGNPLVMDLAEGSYVATAYSTALEVEMSRQFVAIGDGTAVTIAFPEPKASALILAPATAVAGSLIEVGWDGPGEPGDYVGIGATGADGANMWRNWTETSAGNPLKLLVPPDAGPHVIQYFSGKDRSSLGQTEIMVTPVDATLATVTEAPAGSRIRVDWTGPDYPEDYIGIGRVGSEGADRWQNWVYTRDGTPASLVVPAEPGEYEITYFMSQDRTPVTRIALTATDVAARLVAPAEASVGTTLEIGWAGPGYPDDYIGIGPVGAEGASQWQNWVTARDGNPAKLVMPAEPGAYVITYFIGQDRTPLVSVPITLRPVEASITAVSEAQAGSTIEIGWTGPGYSDDYIGIGRADAEGANRWENWISVQDGSPAKLVMPAEPGAYVITYFIGQDRTPLVSVPITLRPVEASITAVSEAQAGSTIEIGWTGPGYSDDYIGIGRADAEGANRWENWISVQDGSPAKLVMPAEPGAYVITYFIGQDRTPLVSVPIVLKPVEASITAPAEALAGSTIDVGWTGPDYKEDYIGIGPANAEGANRWQNWVYTSEGAPARLVMPAEPGDYLITYFQRQDRTPLASVPITLKPLEASVTAPEEAVAGSTIEVGWTGPDYKDDYIGIGPADAQGANRWQNWVYTSEGTPAKLVIPAEPGAYVITYFQRQDRTPLVSIPILVTPVAATLSAPGTAIAGSTIEVAWTGPDYADDYLGIGAADATGAALWQNWVYTRDGSPAALVMPALPGSYVIRYFVRQGRTPIAELPVTVTGAEATLTAPDRAAAGSTVEIAWTGPDYVDDYIGLGLASASGAAQWKSWAYTRDGSPVRIEVPETPGEYRIRYFMRQDRTILAERTLIVD